MSLDRYHSTEPNYSSEEAQRQEVLARIERFESAPKALPAHATLRDCLLATLSCHDMAVITRTSAVSHANRNAIEKVVCFDLFRTYKDELKIDAHTTQALHYFWQAVGSTDRSRRMACRIAIVFDAIRKRLRDPSLLAQREAMEIGETCSSTNPAHRNANRL